MKQRMKAANSAITDQSRRERSSIRWSSSGIFLSSLSGSSSLAMDQAGSALAGAGAASAGADGSLSGSGNASAMTGGGPCRSEAWALSKSPSFGGVSALLTSPVGSMVLSTARSRFIWLALRIASRASSSSASRTSWSMPLWNSEASLRALRTQKATVFIAFGKSFGPITTRATSAMTAISDQPISSITAPEGAGPLEPAAWKAADASALDGFLPLGRGRGLAALQAGGIGVLGLRPAFLLLEAPFEGVDPHAHILHELRDLAAAAEQQQNHGQHDQPSPNAKTSHLGRSPILARPRGGGYWLKRPFSRNVPLPALSYVRSTDPNAKGAGPMPRPA